MRKQKTIILKVIKCELHWSFICVSYNRLLQVSSNHLGFLELYSYFNGMYNNSNMDVFWWYSTNYGLFWWLNDTKTYECPNDKSINYMGLFDTSSMNLTAQPILLTNNYGTFEIILKWESLYYKADFEGTVYHVLTEDDYR